MKSHVTRVSLIVGLMAPIIGLAAVLAAPRTGSARDTGCSCSDYCNSGTANCTILICSDGTSQNCKGAKKPNPE